MSESTWDIERHGELADLVYRSGNRTYSARIVDNDLVTAHRQIWDLVDEHENWTIGECAFCGYETKVRDYQYAPPSQLFHNGRRKLCSVCANTPAGNAEEYPNQYKDTELMKLVAWGINRILDEVRSPGGG